MIKLRTPVLTATCLALLLPFWAPASEVSRISPVEIYVEDNADPFSRPDGSGYANDVVTAALNAAGVNIKLTVVPYARCKQQVIKGRVAACFNMSYSKELANTVKLADTPLFSVTPVYFENLANPLKARRENELGEGDNIGIVHDYEYPDSAMQIVKRGGLLSPARSEQINLKKLAAGRLSSALVMTNDLTGASFWLDDAGVRGKVGIAFRSQGHQDAYFGVSTRHPRGLWLLEQYQSGMKRISSDGTLAKIKAKWSSPQ